MSQIFQVEVHSERYYGSYKGVSIKREAVHECTNKAGG